MDDVRKLRLEGASLQFAACVEALARQARSEIDRDIVLAYLSDGNMAPIGFDLIAHLVKGAMADADAP